MSRIEENSYEWAEFNLPVEAKVGPGSLSPLARMALALNRKVPEQSAINPETLWHLRAAPVLGNTLLLGP